MKNATMRRLSYGLGVLLVLLGAVGIYTVGSIQATRESLEEAEGGEAGAAVSEMKTHAGELGDGASGYVETDDPAYREQAEEARSGFEEARVRYDSSVGEGEGRGSEIGVLYEEYAALGETLINENDEQEAAHARVGETFDEIENTLDEVRENAASGLDGSRKAQEAASMSTAADSLEESLASYLQERRRDFLNTASSSTGDFNRAHARFERLRLNAEERNQAAELETLLDEAIAGSNDVLDIDGSLQENEQEFSGLRADLEGVLDEEAQAQRNLYAERAQETTSRVLGRTQTLILLAFAAVLLALAAVPLIGSETASRLGVRFGRWADRFAHTLKEATDKVRRGDVDVERRLLPVGIMLAAFLWVGQSILEAYVFDGGDFLGALFPSRAEELLSRGLLAVALISFLAYVQYAINSRKQENEARGPRKENEARSQLAAVVESSDDAIIGRRLDGRVTSWNSGARRLYGYTAEEVVGGYGFQMVPSERLNEMLGVLEKLRRRESVKTYETVHVDKNGRLIDVALTISQIKDSKGDPIGYSTIARDITDRKRSEETLRQQKDLYEALLHAQSEVGEGLLILEDGRIVYTNEAFSQISGYGPRELMALPSVLDLVVPEERASFGQRLRRRLGGRADEDNQETVILHKDGRRVMVETGIKTIQTNDRPQLIAILRDITERKKAEEALQESEEKYRMLVETVQEGFGIIDAQARITYCNVAYAAIFELMPRDLVGRSLLEFLDQDEEEALRRTFLRGDSAGGSYEIAITTGDGKRKHLSASATPVTDAEGRFQGAVHAIIDITERKRAEERLARMARYDHLTGLGNRVLFQERLARALARASRNEEPVALMFLDLDRFKSVNDTLGHAFGDWLLKKVAERLRGCVRETDTIARMGGDEFSIILEGLSNGQDAILVARKIVDALSRPFNLSGHEVFVTSSIGIAVSPPSPDAELTRDADAAMYRAKQLGSNNYQFYTPEMNAQAFERLDLERDLRRALDQEEFVLRYQPRVDLVTGRIVGAEALLRWQHPHLGLVSPSQFIHVLEDSGLIDPVGDWTLRAACAQCKAWEYAGLAPQLVAVNLSTRQFDQRALVDRLAQILDETGLDPSCLELELTESLLVEDINTSSAVLDELRTFLGVRLSIDDFGTGYSSLSYLKRFPLDTLKIDQSFVWDVATDPDDAAIVSYIIGLAHTLGLKVVAEGVEKEEQLAYLREHGCDQAQGYYFGEPLPAEDFLELLKRGKMLLSASVRD